MNVHHLELFYYVARHGGISEAVRKMPYGIQQPAVSGQILQLEDSLGLPLFVRRPFALTKAGQDLYDFIAPFFSGLDNVEKKLSGGSSQLIRIAASSIILKDHLPALLQNVRTQFPNLKLLLQSGSQSEVLGALENQEVDLVITSIDGKFPAGIKHEVLLELPLVLVVEKKHPARRDSDFWSQDRISETLIGLPAREAISKQFQASLVKQNVTWPVGIEVNSLDLIESYVAAGFGIGLTVAIPGQSWNPAVRAIPLTNFPSVNLVIAWRGKLDALHEEVLNQCISKARALNGATGKRSPKNPKI